MYKRNQISFADLFSSTNLNSSIEVSSQRTSASRSLSQFQCSQTDLFESQCTQRYEETPKKVPTMMTDENMFETNSINRNSNSIKKKQFSLNKHIEQLDKKEDLDMLMKGLDTLSIEVKDMASSLNHIIKQPENIYQMISESLKEMERKQDEILKGLEERQNKKKVEKEILSEIKKLKDTLMAQEMKIEKLGNSVASVKVYTDESLSQYAKELTDLFKSFNQMNEKRNSSFFEEIKTAWDVSFKTFNINKENKGCKVTQKDDSWSLNNGDSDSDNTVFYQSNPASEYHCSSPENKAGLNPAMIDTSSVSSIKNLELFPQQSTLCTSEAVNSFHIYNKASLYGNFSFNASNAFEDFKKAYKNEKEIYKNEVHAPKNLIGSDSYNNIYTNFHDEYHSAIVKCNTSKRANPSPAFFQQQKPNFYKTDINHYRNFSIINSETEALDLTIDEHCTKFKDSLPLDLTFDNMLSNSFQETDIMIKDDENKDALDDLVERYERMPLRHAPYNKPRKTNDICNNSFGTTFYYENEIKVEKAFEENSNNQNSLDTFDTIHDKDQGKDATVEVCSQNKENVDKFKLKTRKKTKKQTKRKNRSLVGCKKSRKNGKNMCMLSQAYSFKDQKFEEESFNNEEISMYDSDKENINPEKEDKMNEQPSTTNELAETELSSGFSNSSMSSAESVSQMFTILDII